MLAQFPVRPLSQTLFTLSTLPTLTPAIRTGESLRMLAAFLKTAWSSKWLWNGIDFVHAKYVPTMTRAIRIRALRTRCGGFPFR